MNLSELKTGEKAVVVKVSGHSSFRRRIAEMGFIKGNEVKVTMNAPLKDPIEYEIIGYRLSLRRKEACQIEVISEAEAKNFEFRQSTLAIANGRRVNVTGLEERMKALAENRSRDIRVALVGNPNCGKTSLFNVASGAHEHVGNYSGVTVDIKEGRFDYGGYRFTIVDLPGTYSLSTLSPEELYVRKSLIETMPDVVINVVDSSNLERNLYLTTQLIDMDVRMVMAFNMYDEFLKRKDEIDVDQLGVLLGMPVVPTVSKGGKGISELFDAVIRVYENVDPRPAHNVYVNHGVEIEKSVEKLGRLIQETPELNDKYSTRYLAIKYLERDKEIEAVVENLKNRDDIIAERHDETERVENLLGQQIVDSIVEAKYAFVRGALAETYKAGNGSHTRQHTLTGRIDAVVTNKWAAFPIFLLVLFSVFELTFLIGKYPVIWMTWLLDKFGWFTGAHMPTGWWLSDMLVNGVIGGVGAVIAFMPNILILYFFISILEDSGYMARVAFITDKLMHLMGLHGKSFIPMIMGFGCNVPGIVATRSIGSRKSQLITLLIIPFVACAGRLPLFVLIAGAFFPRCAGIVLFCLYLFGILTAILSAKLLSRFIKEDNLPFVMELPPYRMPTGKSVLRHTWEKGKQYMRKTATTTLVFSLLVWLLGYFPHHPEYSPSEQLERSALGAVGKTIEPVMAPIGMDWKMGTGMIAGIGAKEVILSTLGVIYSSMDDETDDVETGPATSETTDLESITAENAGSDRTKTENRSFTPLQRALLRTVTPAAALAFMVFILLYSPCLATFVAIKSETGKWSWAFFDLVYSLLVAWIMAFIVYRIALLL